MLPTDLNSEPNAHGLVPVSAKTVKGRRSAPRPELPTRSARPRLPGIWIGVSTRAVVVHLGVVGVRLIVAARIGAV